MDRASCPFWSRHDAATIAARDLIDSWHDGVFCAGIRGDHCDACEGRDELEERTSVPLMSAEDAHNDGDDELVGRYLDQVEAVLEEVLAPEKLSR